MKKLAKSVIVAILNWQVRRLQKKNSFKVIAVAGSIGKTSTKFAIATVLKQKLKVQFQEGNYNDVVTVPLIFFGLDQPSLMNPLAWTRALIKAEIQVHKPYPYEVVVIELGTDYPGNLLQFRKYLHVDLSVVTAITPEHMEFFADLGEVAKEELSVKEYSDKLLVNIDLCPDNYLKDLGKPMVTYATKQKADYYIDNLKYTDKSYDFDFMAKGKLFLHGSHEVIAETQLNSIAAAGAVAEMMGLSPEELEAGIKAIKPVNGRMQRLNGIKNSTIIDDTYNASPEAMKSALDTIYKLEAPQKIALLGNMNELGKYSEGAHTEIGSHCDPKRLDLVITLGPDANKFLAEAAEKQDCKVERSETPYQAADIIRDNLQEGAVILAKGSQNGVFAEEAVKLLLADPADQSKLVRQSSDWLKIKEKNFKKG